MMHIRLRATTSASSAFYPAETQVYEEANRDTTGWTGTDCSMPMCTQGFFDPFCTDLPQAPGGEVGTSVYRIADSVVPLRWRVNQIIASSVPFLPPQSETPDAAPMELVETVFAPRVLLCHITDQKPPPSFRLAFLHACMCDSFVLAPFLPIAPE